MPLACGNTSIRRWNVSAITTFPAWSTATPQATIVARLVGPPAPNGPADPVPAGVVNRPVCSLTLRTEVSARYSWPAENATPDSPLPQALDGAVLLASDICVAGPGPPTPPATVVITPPAARCVPAGALPAGALPPVHSPPVHCPRWAGGHWAGRRRGREGPASGDQRD